MSPVSNKRKLGISCTVLLACCCGGHTDGDVSILCCLFDYIKVIEATLDNLDTGVFSCKSAGRFSQKGCDFKIRVGRYDLIEDASSNESGSSGTEILLDRGLSDYGGFGLHQHT